MPELDISELRPTLIIGLGGTGKIILTRLRAYLEKRFPGTIDSTNPWKRRVHLLELDIDPAVEMVRADARQITLREDEFIDCGAAPAAEVLNLTVSKKYPDLETWMDTSLTVAERSLRRGGQQIRQLGRLSFYWHLGRGSPLYLYKRLNDTIDDLFSQYAIDPTKPLAFSVYIVSSLCGGTGSGMFLDIAYVLRRLLSPRQRVTSLIGVFTMPSFYRAAPQHALQGNTWAALQELNYFMTTPGEERRFQSIRYLPGLDVREVPCTGKPYDFVYLIDSRTEEMTSLASAEALAQVLVNALGLLSASRVGDEAASKINNVPVLREIEAGTVYSSLGVASLVFPAEEAISWCAAKGLQEFVAGSLLAPLSEEDRRKAVQAAEDFLSTRKWKVEDLKARLSQDEEGHSITPRLRDDPRLTPGVLEALPRQGMYEAVRDRINQALPELEAQALEKIRGTTERPGLRAAVAETFKTDLSKEVKAIVNDRERGLEYALAFLQQLEGRLVDLRREVDAGLYRAESDRQTTESAVVEAERVFRERARRAGGLFGGDPRRARDDYLRVVQGRLERTVEYRAWEEARNLIIEARKEAETWRRQVEDTKNFLSGKATAFFQEAQKEALEFIWKMDRLRNRPILLGPVGKEREGLIANLEEIYGQYCARAQESLREKFYGVGGQMSSLLEAKELPHEDLLAWGKEAFRDIARIRLEDLIQKMAAREGRNANEYLTQTFRNAAYLWSIREAEAVAGGRFKQVVTVIGLEDTATSIYAGTYADVLAPVVSLEGTTTISTGDHYRLTVLKMGHGLRFQDYDWSLDYLGAYRVHMQGLKPVHVFPEFNLNPLVKGKVGRKEFALGLAYGLIQKERARSYVVVPEVAGDPSKKLSEEKGLFDALWVLVHDNELVSELQRRRQTYESKDKGPGKEELLRQLNGFAKDFATTVPPEDQWLAQILQEEVKTYIQDEAQYF
ncbi:MAG: hypothetical protein FJY85_01845 [Deltaproteobacteria bacterium]|nr:hypothetical protein [Deltaproteobacteria bacterium]